MISGGVWLKIVHCVGDFQPLDGFLACKNRKPRGAPVVLYRGGQMADLGSKRYSVGPKAWHCMSNEPRRIIPFGPNLCVR